MTDDSTTMRILHITDPHLYADADGELRGVRTAESLAAVLRDACAEETPDAVLVTGDIAQDESRGAYERFRDLLAGCGAPVWCLAGNHDDPVLMGEVVAETPFTFGGVATAGAWRVHLLSTWAEGEIGGRLSAEALSAVEADLTAHGDAAALLCLHHHPVPVGSRWLDGIGLAEADGLLELADRHTQVRGIVWGHVHQELDRRRNHYRLLATPSTCRQFMPGRDEFAVDDRPPAWRWLELSADGSLDTRLRWLDRSTRP
ncbi:metallophosphoesterase [Lentisalinibacter salinarum]|uniref:metallophosphoesterase n=1 Tax=Lentisalinibacter salinarum TaxID=2992239 RepID=UPI00386C638C